MAFGGLGEFSGDAGRERRRRRGYGHLVLASDALLLERAPDGEGEARALDVAEEGQLCGGAAADNLNGGEGNDYLNAGDDAGGDVLDCGGGTDRYTADPGDTAQSSCETPITPPPPLP